MGNVMSNVRTASPYQAQAGPRQYHLQDEFGNFEYAYANKDSEKIEKGNDMSVRGRYAYTSKSQGRIKRSVKPDVLQTRMTSFMDSSSLRDNSRTNPNVYNMMGQDMSNNMQRDRMNQMSSQRNMYGMMDRSSNMRDNNMMGRNIMNEKMMGLNIMGQNMYSNIMGRDMSSNT